MSDENNLYAGFNNGEGWDYVVNDSGEYMIFENEKVIYMMDEKEVKGRCIGCALYDDGSCNDIGWRLPPCDKAIFIKIPWVDKDQWESIGICR